MFKKIKRKTKNFFCPIFKLENLERGEIITGLVILVGFAIAGVVAWAYRGEILEGLAGAVTQILLILSTWALDFSGEIFKTVAGGEFVRSSITRSEIVKHGWRIIRDLANMGIVLGFVVVGIATALRIREYQARQTLVPLIIVALLINFSMLITGIIIDATNITMDYFLNTSGAGEIVRPITEQIKSQEVKNKMEEVKNKEFEYFGAALPVIAYNVIAAMVFFLFALLFLFRHVALMCLVILSPLAFFCYVFKATKGIWTKWWNNFLQWSIIGIPAAFFMYLAGRLLVDGGVAAGGTLAFLVPVAFLLIGYTLCFQSGASGASAAMGLGKAAGAVALGAGLWTAKKTWGGAKKAGQTKAGSRALGRLGLTKPGTFEQKEAKTREEEKKRMDAIYAQNPDRVRRFAEKDRTKRGAAALATLAEHGKFDRTRHEHLVDRATAFGWERGIFENADPNIVKGDRNKLIQLTDAGMSQTKAEEQVKREAIERKVGSMTPAEYRKMNSNAITPAVLAASTPRQVQRTGAAGSPELINAFKKYKPNRDPITKKMLPLSEQTPEIQELCRNNPAGSPVRKRVNQLLAKIGKDKNFS